MTRGHLTPTTVKIIGRLVTAALLAGWIAIVAVSVRKDGWTSVVPAAAFGVIFGGVGWLRTRAKDSTSGLLETILRTQPEDLEGEPAGGRHPVVKA